MKKNLTTKQLINAELATRSFNNRAKNIIKAHSPEESVPELIIDFHCECSDRDCQERVPLTVEQYEQIHSNNARFILAKGHEEPLVEKVKTNLAGFNVVEKHALS